MDSDQRLEALRKAYADVILNMSKESAARVMAAEMKAQQMERETQKTKDEASQVMARLKKKMDDAISEANMLSRKQQQKIDEIEAQLQEAEDIVTELREKLRYEQAKSDRVTRSDMQHLDQRDYAIPEEEFVDHRQSQSIPCPPLQFQKDSLVASYKENPYLHQRTEYPRGSSEPQMRNLYGATHELPSIILRSKKHNLSRNACTQRIQACERNILDNELSLSREQGDASRQGNVEGANKDISTCKVTFNEVRKMFNIESKEVVDKNGCISCCYEVQPAKLIPEEVETAAKHRKNKTTKTNFNDKEGNTEMLISKGPVKSAAKYRKNKSALGKKTPTKLFMKGQETPGVPHSDPGLISIVDNLRPNENPTAMKPKVSSALAGMETQLGCAKTTDTNDNYNEGDTDMLISKGEPSVKTVMKYRNDISALSKKIPDELFTRRHETPGFPHSDPSPKPVEVNPQPNEDPTLMTSKLSLDIEAAGLETRLVFAETTEANGSDKEGDTEKLISKGEPLVNMLVYSVQEGASAESSDIQVSKLNLKKVDEPVQQSNLKSTDATSKGASVQYFKYTFQRKRKRETVSISDK